MKVFKKIMKSTLAAKIALLLTPVLLTSCAAGELFVPTPPDMNLCYSLNIVVPDILDAISGVDGVNSSVLSGGSEDFCATIIRNDINNWRVQITAPYSLSGVDLTVIGTEITASYGDFSTSVTAENALYSPLVLILSAFDRLAVTEGLTTAVSNDLLNVSGADFTCVFDENKQPVSLLLDSLQLEIALSDFTVIAVSPDIAIE